MIAFDSEQGGLDQFHGVRPFFLSVCGPDGPSYREWTVDPLTRRVQVVPADVEWLRGVIGAADRVVGHNIAFDFRGLEHLGIAPPWGKFEDTMVAAHVLFSAPPHNLTHCAKVYLDEYIEAHETLLEKAVKKCRSMVQQARLKEGRGKTDPAALSPLRKWDIAEDGHPGLPSGDGEGVWRSDYWLPRSVYDHDPADPDHTHYATVLRDYALVDAVTTYHLWNRLEELLRGRGLWNVYRAKLAVVPAAYRMERRGMTVDRTVLRAAQERYGADAEEASELLVGIARTYGYDLQLPKGATNHNLDDFIFGRAGRTPEGKRDAKLPRTHAPDTLNLPVVVLTESGAPSFGGDARDIWLGELPKNTKPHLFVETLGRRAELTTGLSYLSGYERFLLPVGDGHGMGHRGGGVCGDHGGDRGGSSGDGVLPTGMGAGGEGRGGERTTVSGPHGLHAEGGGPDQGQEQRFVIHPSFRVCGTQTTRWSSNNPNAQNLSLQSAVKVRNCFGPVPGREWYSMDAANIELRIPAYLAGEKELIDVFERPDEGPYYGSYHLVIFDTLYPELFARHGKKVKDPPFEDTHYKPVKNGNFARQYGAQERKVDATFRCPGAYRLIAARFPRIDALNRAVIAGANRDGCVFTVPDREVDIEHGYQIVCRRNARDTISPTVPFAYFVSGTAGWWLNSAIVKCDRLMERWRAEDGYDGHLIASVHDEIVFDTPLTDGRGNPVDNVPRMKAMRDQMESVGRSMGIPVPVKIDRHRVTWAVGEEVV